jgi:hypothetical protein
MAAMSEATTPPTESTGTDPLEAGRKALARHLWPEAFEQLSPPIATAELSGADLESLALAAFFAAQADIALDVKERAFRRTWPRATTFRAAYLAIDVARTYGFQGKTSIAAAWGRRAGRDHRSGRGHLRPRVPGVGQERGSPAAGNVDEALALAELAVAIGTRAADADLKASALTNLGSLKIAAGSTRRRCSR